MTGCHATFPVFQMRCLDSCVGRTKVWITVSFPSPRRKQIILSEHELQRSISFLRIVQGQFQDKGEVENSLPRSERRSTFMIRTGAV